MRDPRPSEVAAARLKKKALEKLGQQVEPWVKDLASQPLKASDTATIQMGSVHSELGEPSQDETQPSNGWGFSQMLPDLRSRKRDELRERIFKTAMQLFQEHGFDQVSEAQIAAEADVSMGKFHDYYPSKENIIFAPMPTVEQMEPFIRQMSGLPVEERIVKLMPQFLGEFLSEDRGELLARWQLISTTSSLRLRASELEQTAAETVIKALLEPEDQPVTGINWEVVRVYLAAYTSALLIWATINGKREITEIVDRIFHAMDKFGEVANEILAE